jgi:hypothetical protein
MAAGTFVNFYLMTRRYKPEDSHLRTHRRENLKSYLIDNSFSKLLPRAVLGISVQRENYSWPERRKNLDGPDLLLL